MRVLLGCFTAAVLRSEARGAILTVASFIDPSLNLSIQVSVPLPKLDDSGGQQARGFGDPSETDGQHHGSGEANEARWKVVSLFSGCGGMDLGFLGGFGFGQRHFEKLPYEVIWANDIDSSACATYRLNIGREILCCDVAEALANLPKEADVIIGGFPCQDVSINGKRQGKDGRRTVLYQYMVEAIQRLRPQAFVAENVKGLLMSHGKAFFDQMLSDFEATGYHVSPKLYLAADYGVPQMRERIFLVGVKPGLDFQHPAPVLQWVTAAEALGDLESVAESPEIAHRWSKAARSPDQGSRRLVANRPATTIRAEHHGNVQWHYRLNRRISLREAARLQSFPDDFEFPAGMRQTERQIGNAVPPVLAWHIADALASHLE